MIIVDKNSENRRNHKFLFSKIIKLKIPKPHKYKSNHQSDSSHQGGKRQLTIQQKIAINRMINNAQWPIELRARDKQSRYSKLHKSNYKSIQRSSTNNEVRMRPVGIRRLANNYTTKTLECEARVQGNEVDQSRRSGSIKYLFSGEYSSARFFSKSVERQKTIVKKDSAESINQNGLGRESEFSLKMLPFIKKLCTFSRVVDGKKGKSRDCSFRKFQQIVSERQITQKQHEIRGWQGDPSFQEEEQNEYKVLGKYNAF